MMAVRGKIAATLVVVMTLLLPACSSKKYDSWSDCMSGEINKNKNVPAAEAYCDANYDMTQRERNARRVWACNGREWAPECKPVGQAPEAMATEPVITEPVATEAVATEAAGPRQPIPTSAGGRTAPTIADYDGRYPSDAVRGYRVFDHPRIAQAIDRLRLSRGVRKFIEDGSAVAPAISVGQWELVASGCEAHNCAGKNWKLEYHINEDAARVCFYDSAGPASLNRWLPDGDRTSEGDCF